MNAPALRVIDGALALPAAAYLARLAPGSRPAMRSALRALAGRIDPDVEWHSMPWHRLRRVHTSALRAWLVDHYSPATANRHLAALRGVLREAWRAGEMGDAEYHRAADLPAVKATRLPAGRGASPDDLRALFAAATSDRDRATLALLVGAGLRRSEVSALAVDDVDLASGEVIVRAGKGRRDRVAWVGASALAHLRTHAATRPAATSGQDRFVDVGPDAIYKLVRLAAKRAGVADLTPHDLRRTFVTNLLEAGADLSVVKELAGHADIQTTARYDRRGERAKRAAAQLLAVPS